MSTENKSSVSAEAMLRNTTHIVAAFVGHNNVTTKQIPDVIKTVHTALASLCDVAGAPAAPKPAVPVKRSITNDFLVCLEDGKRLKMLKRHLRTTYNLTPEEYRAKWGLPADYPMVAPGYAQQRSDFAKRIGLGKRPARGSNARSKVARGAINQGADRRSGTTAH